MKQRDITERGRAHKEGTNRRERRSVRIETCLETVSIRFLVVSRERVEGEALPVAPVHVFV
eukprot:1323051-Amorphochlora_amoeboformis.AAC.1